MAGIPNFANLQPEDFQNLHAQVQQLHAQVGIQAMSEEQMANLVQTGTTSLRTDISNLQSIVNNMSAPHNPHGRAVPAICNGNTASNPC